MEVYNIISNHWMNRNHSIESRHVIFLEFSLGNTRKLEDHY